MTTVKDLGTRSASKTYALGYPLAIGDVDYREVTIRRPSTGDRAKFNAAAAPDAAENVRVLVATPDGKPITPEVWNALDADDTDAITAAAREYLPKMPPRPDFAPGTTVTETVPLAYPIAYDGRTYDAVTVRRLSIGALAAFMEARGSAPQTSAVFRYPIYFDGTGAPIPDLVLDALEMSDHAKVVEVSDRFLPRESPAEAA